MTAAVLFDLIRPKLWGMRWDEPASIQNISRITRNHSNIMKRFSIADSNYITTPALAVLGLLICAGVTRAQITGTFTENFSGSTLAPNWTLSSPSPGALNGSGQFVMSAPPGGTQTTIQDNTGGTAGSFVSDLNVWFNPMTSAPATETDFNWRFFGPNGFVEVVFNNFSELRVYSSAAGGNVGDIPNLTSSASYADGATLNLTMSYNQPSDTFQVLYGLNGGAQSVLGSYTGAGNFYTSWTDCRMDKWGNTNPNQAYGYLDSWDLQVAPVPEPTTLAFAGLAGLASLIALRRKQA
jgi:hypothetical protein